MLGRTVVLGTIRVFISITDSRPNFELIRRAYMVYVYESIGIVCGWIVYGISVRLYVVSYARTRCCILFIQNKQDM